MMVQMRYKTGVTMVQLFALLVTNLVLNCKIVECAMLLPRSDCFKRPAMPRDTVYFVADDVDSCVFWRCLTPLTAIKMKCAPGSKLPNNYIGGSGNPCTVRYFQLGRTTCHRPPSTTTTTATTTTNVSIPPILPTLSGGIIIPTEITGPVTRPPLTTIIDRGIRLPTTTARTPRVVQREQRIRSPTQVLAVNPTVPATTRQSALQLVPNILVTSGRQAQPTIAPSTEVPSRGRGLAPPTTTTVVTNSISQQQVVNPSQVSQRGKLAAILPTGGSEKPPIIRTANTPHQLGSTGNQRNFINVGFVEASEGTETVSVNTVNVEVGAIENADTDSSPTSENGNHSKRV